MTQKKLPQTIEECNAELERTQKQLQQYENRNKIANYRSNTGSCCSMPKGISLITSFISIIIFL